MAEQIDHQTATIDIDKAETDILSEFGVQGIPAVWAVDGETAQRINPLTTAKMLQELA